MSSVTHSNSVILESSKYRESQCSSKKKKVIFEEELRGYKPKEASKATATYDPMMEKLKQWKKEREIKQSITGTNSQIKQLKTQNGINLLQKKTFESSLRSYKKQSLSPANQGKSRLQSSIQQFYDRVNNNRSTKSMSSSQYIANSLSRSTLFSNVMSQSHKKGYYSENNSVCPSLDKNNIDFIDQIEDRIEDLYYDFMEGNIIDRQQMRKEVIDILHMCQIKIVKGKMVGGFEEIKGNQQLWYIFLLNFDFKPTWKENALNFIKENNIMQKEHLEFAEQNMRIITDDQMNTPKQLNQSTSFESINKSQNGFFIKFEQMDNLKLEDNIKQENMEKELNFQVSSILDTIKEEIVETTQDTLINNAKTIFEVENEVSPGMLNESQINQDIQQITERDITQNNIQTTQQSEVFQNQQDINLMQKIQGDHQEEQLLHTTQNQQQLQTNQNDLQFQEKQLIITKQDQYAGQNESKQDKQDFSTEQTSQGVAFEQIQNDQNLIHSNQNNTFKLPKQQDNQNNDPCQLISPQSENLQNQNESVNQKQNQMEEEEAQKESLMIPENVFKKFEFLQAEIAHSYSKAQRILAQSQSNNKKLSEAQKDLIELSYGSQLLETPSYSEPICESNIKSIVKKLDYKLTLDNQQPLFDLSPWRDLKKLNEQANKQNSIFKSSQSIFNHSQNKQIETDSFLEKQKERMYKFSFGNNNQLTPLEQEKTQNNQQEQSQFKNITQSGIDNTQKDIVQKQLFDKINQNYEGQLGENLLKQNIQYQTLDKEQKSSINCLQQSDKNKEKEYCNENFSASKIFTEQNQNKLEKETQQQRENGVCKINIFRNNSSEKKNQNSQNQIQEKENISKYDQTQSGIVQVNNQQSPYKIMSLQQKKIQLFNHLIMDNQHQKTEKEFYVQLLNKEEEEDKEQQQLEKLGAIKKKIRNEEGNYQNVYKQQIPTQSNLLDQQGSSQISNLLNGQEQKPTFYHDEFSFNFIQLTKEQKYENNQNNLFNIVKVSNDEQNNSNNSEQQNTCDFSSIINNASNLTNNNNIFQSLNQNLIQNNTSFSTTNIQNLNNTLLIQTQDILQNQIQHSNQNTIDQLHSQNHFNITTPQNNIETQQVSQNVLSDNQNDCNNILKSQMQLIEQSPQKFYNSILRQKTSEKRRSIFSSKKKSLIFSPQVFESYIQSEKKQSQDFIQNLSQSKKKSLLGLDVQDIIKTQVREDFGSEFVKLTIALNSVKKQKKSLQEKDIESNNQNISMQWVRRSLRLMNNQSPPSSQSLKNSCKKQESSKIQNNNLIN